MIERYRKKPIEIEAVHCTFFNRMLWQPDLAKVCEQFGLTPVLENNKINFYNGSSYNGRQLVGLSPIKDGDYLVIGIDDSIYPVQKDTFEKIYEKVNTNSGEIVW